MSEQTANVEHAPVTANTSQYELLLWVQHWHLSFSKCIRILNIHLWKELYGRVAINYIRNRISLIRTFKSQVRNMKHCRDSLGYKSSCAYSVNCYALAFVVSMSVLFYQMLLKWCFPIVSFLKEKLITNSDVLT
jgi:hypothetical protein